MENDMHVMDQLMERMKKPKGVVIQISVMPAKEMKETPEMGEEEAENPEEYGEYDEMGNRAQEKMDKSKNQGMTMRKLREMRNLYKGE